MRAAAAAGYAVVAVDAFGDADTRAQAAAVLQLPYRDGGFDAAEVRRRVLPLLGEDAGLVYGSGFETQPELLEEIARRGRVYGNSAETVRMLKHPGRFFSLLAELELPFPETRLTLPETADGWLRKCIGGSGGVHVAPLVAGEGAGGYCQRQLPGRPCSLLFLADGRDIVVVGYNEQWLAPAPGMPFRYGGAVGNIALPAPACAAMQRAAQQLARAAGLRGLNSLDCMVHGEQAWVLEVNPRLSATFALYDTQAYGANLLRAHLQACAGVLDWAARAEGACAHLIYYAPFGSTIPPGLAWPPWVADVPLAGSTIRAGEPLCSVMACAPEAAGAAALVHRRARDLQQQLKHLQG